MRVLPGGKNRVEIGLTDLQSVWGLIAWVSCESLTTVALKEIVTVFYVGIPNL